MNRIALSLLLIGLAAWPEPSWAGKGPNTTIDTAELGAISINDRTKVRDEEERAVFYRDGDAAIGINGDGDPNVGMKF